MAEHERYYAERFGRVERSRSPLRGVAITGFVLPFLLHDRWHPIGPCLAILWLGAFPVRLVYECWPYRNHHLVTVTATVLAAVNAFHVPSAYDALAQAFILIGIAEVPCGFADHALLVRAMTAMKTREVDALADTEHADTI